MQSRRFISYSQIAEEEEEAEVELDEEANFLVEGLDQFVAFNNYQHQQQHCQQQQQQLNLNQRRRLKLGQDLHDQHELKLDNYITMATVRPISPQYQHTLDSAISLAKELASKNMADSGDSSPKTPNSPDKKRFNFKLKHYGKSFSEASADIRDLESSISYEAKQAYKSLVERGPYKHQSYQHSYNTSSYHSNPHHHHHHHSMSSHSRSSNQDEFSPSSSSRSSFKHMGIPTFSVKKSFF